MPSLQFFSYHPSNDSSNLDSNSHFVFKCTAKAKANFRFLGITLVGSKIYVIGGFADEDQVSQIDSYQIIGN